MGHDERRLAIEERVLAWFESERGIKPETLGRFGVDQDGEWISFPYSWGRKFRSDPTSDGPRRFQTPKGVSVDLFTDRDAVGTATMFLCEGETDTMRLAQELDFEHTVLGLPGATSWQPHFAERFARAERVYVILDNDQAYPATQATEKAWKQIRHDLGKKARRVVLPSDVKDVCAFFDKYDLDLFRELCARKNPLVSKLTRLDLTQPAPEPNWLVDGWICSGDVHILIGDPGLGKSFLTMGLSIALADGHGKWLDLPVRKQGRVMYVDEENPADIILTRFHKLGLSDRGAGNIHFLHRPGIWLNKEPEVLLDEAIEIEPDLIVLDALTALHSIEENNANAMRGLFKEAIIPLARDTGAAVIVIHHTTKAEDGSSFKRARGSGDISAVVDAALDARGTGERGELVLSQYKSRRSLGGGEISVQIADVAPGRVALKTRELPF